MITLYTVIRNDESTMNVLHTGLLRFVSRSILGRHFSKQEAEEAIQNFIEEDIKWFIFHCKRLGHHIEEKKIEEIRSNKKRFTVNCHDSGDFTVHGLKEGQQSEELLPVYFIYECEYPQTMNEEDLATLSKTST
jgi:hypothetical protein